MAGISYDNAAGAGFEVTANKLVGSGGGKDLSDSGLVADGFQGLGIEGGLVNSNDLALPDTGGGNRSPMTGYPLYKRQ
jgi:hypothetical protein